MLSVVIPALNAARTLPACLEALEDARRNGLVREVILADGGSSDGTVALAARAGARVLVEEPGRGGQLVAGAQAARAPWLLFLHADTLLEPGWEAEVRDFIAETGDGETAAVFRFALDDDKPAARRVERMVAWRGRTLGLPYGDQGLLISRAFYDLIGGFEPLPLMEDVDIVRRIGKSRLAVLNSRAVTDAIRYRQSGYIIRPLRNMVLLTLFFLGLPPRLLARLYG